MITFLYKMGIPLRTSLVVGTICDIILVYKLVEVLV